MSSDLSTETHRAPRQERSERRLASFLKVAADLFTEVGFESATMTAIAERSGTSIGGLYHYFPDKESIARALVQQLGSELELEIRAIVEDSRELSIEQFAHVLIDRIIAFFNSRQAYFTLVAAGMKYTRGPAERRPLRELLASAYQSRNPDLNSGQALRAANVTFEVIKALRNQYSETTDAERLAVVAEYRKLLALYLGSFLVP